MIKQNDEENNVNESFHEELVENEPISSKITEENKKIEPITNKTNENEKNKKLEEEIIETEPKNIKEDKSEKQSQYNNNNDNSMNVNKESITERRNSNLENNSVKSENENDSHKNNTTFSNKKITPYSSNISGYYPTNKPPSSKSSKMKQSIIDKSNPAYLYLKELQRSQEFMKKRNQTARLYKTKMNFNMDKTNTVGFGNFSKTNSFPSKNKKKENQNLEKTHLKMLSQMNDPKNPYSTYWSSKILEKRYNMQFGVTGFLNGVPVINVQKKKSEVCLYSLILGVFTNRGKCI